MYNFIKNVEIFDGLTDAVIFKLCEFMEKKMYKKGHVLFDDQSYMYTQVNKTGTGFSLCKTTSLPSNMSPAIIPGFYILLSGQLSLTNPLTSFTSTSLFT